MHIIILGAGEVGTQLTKRISGEEHDVILIDKDPDRINEIKNKLDCQTLIGKSGDFDVLLDAQIDECNMLIAVTDVDEVNMIACLIANRFNVPVKIARIRSQQYRYNNVLPLSEVGIDYSINPEEAATQDIISLIHSPGAFEVQEFEESSLVIKGYRIDKKSPFVDKSLIEIGKYEETKGMLLVAINRQGKTLIPRGNDVLNENDRVYILAHKDKFENFAPLLRETFRPIKKVMIAGANSITDMVCKELVKQKMQIKVIDPNEKDLRTFTAKYAEITNVIGNPTDVELLEEEGISHMDAFVAISENEEINMVSSIIAKRHNVLKTIALIQQPNYLTFADAVGVDAVVSPRQSTVGSIMKYVRKGDIVSVTTFADKDIEAIEYNVSSKSKMLNIPLKEAPLPGGSLIAAIIRNKDTIIPRGDDQLLEGDKVLVLTLIKEAKKIGNLFI